MKHFMKKATAALLAGCLLLSVGMEVKADWQYLAPGDIRWTDENGEPGSGWTKLDDTWYYFVEDGRPVTGWLRENGEWYFMDPNGQMQQGWIQDQGNWYHLGESGAMDTGWLWDHDNWYFLNPDGSMVHNNMVGKWWLTSDGTMATGEPTSLTPEQTAQLNELLGQMGNISVVFEDLLGGASYSFNEDQLYYMASIYKLPYCLWICQMADAGRTDLSAEMTYTQDLAQPGAGIIPESPDGTRFSMAKLIDYALRYSDNTALHMLLHRYSAEDFRQYLDTLGIPDSRILDGPKNGQMTAADGALYGHAVWDYLQSDAFHADLMEQALTNPADKLIWSGYIVAQKYGLWEPNLHTVAIVYGNHPYLLVICSANGVSSENQQDIHQIYQAINQIVRSW